MLRVLPIALRLDVVRGYTSNQGNLSAAETENMKDVFGAHETFDCGDNNPQHGCLVVGRYGHVIGPLLRPNSCSSSSFSFLQSGKQEVGFPRLIFAAPIRFLKKGTIHAVLYVKQMARTKERASPWVGMGHKPR